jgi:Icc-related predicted phosphoesterase
MPANSMLDLFPLKTKQKHNIVTADDDVTENTSTGKNDGICSECGKDHPTFEHWGCKQLRKLIDSGHLPQLRAHCCGHVHDAAGFAYDGKVLFSNAAMKDSEKFNYFEIEVNL